MVDFVVKPYSRLQLHFNYLSYEKKRSIVYSFLQSKSVKLILCAEYFKRLSANKLFNRQQNNLHNSSHSQNRRSLKHENVKRSKKHALDRSN